MRCAVAVCLVILLSAGSLFAAAPVREKPVLEALRPASCRVRVESELGVPLALANGFLIGNGSFLVTDLAALAQAGAHHAVITFSDGTSATAESFGLADPPSGLAVLKIPGDETQRQGVILAKDAPPTDTPFWVGSVAYAWLKDLEFAGARLVPGPTKAGLGPLLGGKPPDVDVPFVRVTGDLVPGTVAAPLADEGGKVHAVRIDLIGRVNVLHVAVPASHLRGALMEAEPKLQPVAEVPQAVWRVPRYRIAGEPPGLTEIEKREKRLQVLLRCDLCKGTGETKWEEAEEFITGRPAQRPRWAPFRVPCPKCHQEKLVFDEGVEREWTALLVGETRVLWDPLAKGRQRHTCAADAVARLALAGQVGPNFCYRMNSAAQKAIRAYGGEAPQGLICVGTVKEHLDATEGAYAVIEVMAVRPGLARRRRRRRAAARGPVRLVIVPLPSDGEETSVGPTVEAGPLDVGRRVVVGGTMQAKVTIEAGKAAYLLPAGWAPAK